MQLLEETLDGGENQPGYQFNDTRVVLVIELY